MKKTIAAVFAAVVMLFAGCKTTKIPSEEAVAKTANKIGASAGFIASQFDVDAKVVEQIKEIATKFTEIVPDKNTTFKQLWMPEVRKLVDTFVAEGQMTELQADLVVTGFKPICSGLDYLFTKKYPYLKEYADLSNVAVDSFVAGFLRTFKPTDVTLRSCAEEYDIDAYNFITEDIK